MRRLLFLDFDGVLNNTDFFERAAVARQALPLDAPYSARDDLDPENLARLADLLRAVPTLEVVVSSSWRCGATLAGLRDFLAPAAPRARVVGVTPRLASRLRHEEITAWLVTNAFGPFAFLALDDDTVDMLPMGANFLHVDRRLGLTAGHVQTAVQFFAAATS